MKFKTIAEYIKHLTDRGSIAMAPFITSGNLNAEYIQGRQYKRIDRRTLRLSPVKNDVSVYTEKLIYNRILPIYLTRYGILTNNMPIPGFRPFDNSAKRVNDAINGNSFIKTFLADTEFKAKFNKLIKHADVYGIVWLKTGIDWSKGNPVCSSEMSTTYNEEKTKGTFTLKEGRPFVEVVPCHEVFIDSLHVEDSSEISELVHRKAFSLGYIKRRWGIDAKREDVITSSLTASPEFTQTGFALRDGMQYAYVYEYYKKADAQYPEGRYVMTINDSIIKDGPLPYENGYEGTRKIPFDCVTLQDIPNHLIGVTVYSQIIPIQDAYNNAKNRILEYMNHVAIGQMFYWDGSIENLASFTNKPGKLIKLKRNSRPPQAVSKEKLSMEFINYFRSIEDDMLITAGLSQLTAYGISKSNVRTDGVVDKIADSDQNKLANAIENISKSLTACFKKVIYCEKYREKILLKQLEILPKDDYINKYGLKNVDAEQLTIVNRDFLMQSDQVLDKKIQQAAGMGLYNPEAHIPFVAKLEMLDAMDSNYLKETLDPSERATHDLVTEEHHSIIVKRIVPEVEDYHIHAQHTYEHNLFRISPEVRRLKDVDKEEYDRLMEAINMHIMKHQEFDSQQESQHVNQDAKAIMQEYNH